MCRCFREDLVFLPKPKVTSFRGYSVKKRKQEISETQSVIGLFFEQCAMIGRRFVMM